MEKLLRQVKELENDNQRLGGKVPKFDIEKEIENDLIAKQEVSLLENESDGEDNRDVQRALYQKSTIGANLGRKNIKPKRRNIINSKSKIFSNCQNTYLKQKFITNAQAISCWQATHKLSVNQKFQMANMNRQLNSDIETCFMATGAGLFYVSSSLVREVAALGGDVEELVPPNVSIALKNNS